MTFQTLALATLAVTGAAAQCMNGGPTRPLGPGSYDLRIDHSTGRGRQFLLEVPRSYNPANPTPLLLSFHGFTNTASQQCGAGTRALADELGYIAVCPQGLGIPSQWNGGECCGDTRRDDVDFARALVAEMADRVCIDEASVYSTGYSNGGYLSYRLACEASDMVSGILNVAGLLSSANAFPCNPERRVPVVHVHGTSDAVINYSVAALGYERYAEQVHSCSRAQTVVYESGPVTCLRKDSCPTDMMTEFCSINRGGHSNVRNNDIDPIRRAFDLFARYKPTANPDYDPNFVFNATTLD